MWNWQMERDFICDLCGPKSVACRRCLDCNQNFCMSCCHIHEKINGIKNHRVSDLGTLDLKMKGKIRHRIFCDQHPEKELELFCRQCKVLICLLCKAVKHNHHDTDTITDAAANVKRILQTKVNSCSKMLVTIAEFIRIGEDLDIEINDAERKDITVIEDQRLQLMKVLDQEVAKMKYTIQCVYKDRKQQNAAFIRYMQDELNMCSDANIKTQTFLEQGSDIDLIKEGPEIEQLISPAVSKTYLTPDTTLERDLFVPGNIKPSEIISMIGAMRESTKISTEEREKALRASKRSIVVVAIDFGTTHSTWAFSFKHEYDADPTKISFRNWIGRHMISCKAPTTVLIQPDGITFDSFGYEAEDKYADLYDSSEYKRWYYFRRFKKLMHKKMLYESNVQLEDETKKSLPAKTVLSFLIRFLKDDALKRINGSLSTDKIMEDEITWVLTVPAMWNVSAKLFMREAAVQAGITKKKIHIALEPETASIFCRLLPIERMEEGERMTAFRPGSKYMVLDAGDETIDITVYEVMTGGKLKEVRKASVESSSRTQVDDAYNEFLIRLVGKPVFQRFQSEFTEDHLEMLRDFEIRKNHVTSENNKKMFIRLPFSLNDIFEEETKENLLDFIKHTHYAEMVSLMGDKLRVDASVMKGLFSKAVQNTVSQVNELMKDGRVQGISNILMVGSFSESRMLQHAIKCNFPNVKVIVPQVAGIAVLKGAVVFGHTLSQ